MTSKISGQWEHIWYGYKRTFHGFVVPILHQAFKHDYDQEKYFFFFLYFIRHKYNNYNASKNI